MIAPARLVVGYVLRVEFSTSCAFASSEANMVTSRRRSKTSRVRSSLSKVAGNAGSVLVPALLIVFQAVEDLLDR